MIFSAISFLAIAGFCVSAYAFFIEHKLKQNADYKPACDISDRVSCSESTRMGFGSILYISNGHWHDVLCNHFCFIINACLCVPTFASGIIGVLTSSALAFLQYVKLQIV